MPPQPLASKDELQLSAELKSQNTISHNTHTHTHTHTHKMTGNVYEVMNITS